MVGNSMYYLLLSNVWGQWELKGFFFFFSSVLTHFFEHTKLTQFLRELENEIFSLNGIERRKKPKAKSRFQMFVSFTPNCPVPKRCFAIANFHANEQTKRKNDKTLNVFSQLQKCWTNAMRYFFFLPSFLLFDICKFPTLTNRNRMGG